MPRRSIRSVGQPGDLLPERRRPRRRRGRRSTQIRSGSRPKPPSSTESGDQLPGELDRALLEVVAEGEVAVHLEERAVPGGLADLLDVQGAHALLHAGGARPTAAARWPMKYGMNCTMPAMTNSRFGSANGSGALGTTVCPLLGEVREEAAADLGGLHRFSARSGRARGVSRAARVGVGYSAEWAPRRSGSCTWSPAGSAASSPVPERSSASRSLAAARTSAPNSRSESARSRSAVDQRAGDAGGGQLLGGLRQLADDERADGDAHAPARTAGASGGPPGGPARPPRLLVALAASAIAWRLAPLLAWRCGRRR